MTSPVGKVTLLQVVVIVLVISPTSVTFAVPEHREDFPSSTTDTNLRNESIFRISSESYHQPTKVDGTTPTTTTQRDTSHSETATTSTATTTATQPTSEHITISTNAHKQTTTKNYVSSGHLTSNTVSSTTPSSIFQQQQQQQLHHNFKQTTDSAERFSHQHKTEPEFTASELRSDLQKEFQELDIRNKIKETFVTLTKGMHLSPDFMFSLFLDLFNHFERTSAETTNDDLLIENEDDVAGGFDDDGVAAAAAYDDDNDFYSHYSDNIDSVYSSYADDQGSEISSENENHENHENESESGFAEKEFEHFDFDIHVNFNRLLRNLMEHFSKHQTEINEEGHRIFLDFLYTVIHHHFDQSARSRTEHHHLQDHHQDNILDYHGIKENYEQLNDKVRIRFNHLLKAIQSNHGRHGHAPMREIPRLEIFEDMHLLLSKIINVEEAGDAELNHCINRCINGWQQRKVIVNKKYSQVSENFFKSKNISRANWDELLVAIQSSTANHTNEVRECKYPMPEVHQISQYRYMLPENNSKTEDNTPISGGQREGKIIPDHVELYRCRHRYGCCNHYDNHQEITRRCAAKNWTIVERVFEEVIVEVVDEEEKTRSIPRFYKFINETECHCKVVSKKNYNCTSSFEFLDEEVNNMNCGCNRQSTSYSICKDIINGLRRISDSDLRCIRLKECLIPSCVHGTFDFDSGLCPQNTAQRSTKSPLREPT